MLPTTTTTGGERMVLPTPSVATATTTCGPSAPVVVSHAIENGAADCGVPRGLASTSNCRLAIPASLCAVAVTATRPDTIAWSPGPVTVATRAAVPSMLSPSGATEANP